MCTLFNSQTGESVKGRAVNGRQEKEERRQKDKGNFSKGQQWHGFALLILLFFS